MVGTWRQVGQEDGAKKLTLDMAGMNGTLWMEPGVLWPVRVELSLDSPALAPHVRSDGGYPAKMTLRRLTLAPGAQSVAPRDRGATFGTDESAMRERWDGEKPPGGDPEALAYPLADAMRDAKLLDKPLADWLAAHDTPILYRATYQKSPGPAEGTEQADWLLSWVDRAEQYYEVQIALVLTPTSPAPPSLPRPVGGVPRVESSAPAQAPADENHGWFAKDTVPEKLVTLSEGMRVVREVFGAQELQIFLRSFADPPGYSYFLDGGFDGTPVTSGETARPEGRSGIEAGGRYTMVYNPGTGFIEEATGPVTPRLSP
jgi:hypothetical protein